MQTLLIYEDSVAENHDAAVFWEIRVARRWHLAHVAEGRRPAGSAAAGVFLAFAVSCDSIDGIPITGFMSVLCIFLSDQIRLDTYK